jgi:transglutaminase-like putative cysteine protease
MSMESKRPQLDRAELQQLRWLFGTALVLLAAWTVPYMDIDAPAWLGLITLAAPLMLWRPELARWLPRWAHRLAFPLFLVLTVLDWRLETGRVLPALVRLTLMLLLYRMTTVRHRREDLQVVVLGLFLVVVAGVLSVSVMFVAQILAFTACALLLLLTLTLAGSAEAAPPEWTKVSWPALARRVRAVTNWRVVLFGGGLFVGLVAVSSVFFILLPRFDLEGTLFFDHLMSAKSRTGFSDEVRLGDFTDLQEDTSIAFHVDVDDPAKVPANLYWRMLVLDKYVGGNFSLSHALDVRIAPLPEKTARFEVPAKAARPSTPVWTFYFEQGISRYLALPGSFTRMVFTEPQQLDADNELRVVRLPRTPQHMLAYKVEGLDLAPALPAPSGDAALSDKPGTLPAYSSLRQISDRDRGRLDGWVKALDAPPDDPEGFARRACAWLAQNHKYGLQVTLPKDPAEPRRDPIVQWMDTTLDGHCEFFAGSFVLLARAAKYPARLVLGFKGGSWNPTSGNLTIRNSDAHSWCEVLDRAKKEWVRVDPTPGSDLLGDAVGSLHGEAVLQTISDRTFSARFDSLRMFWYRRIVDFNQGAQVELAHRARLAVEDFGRRLKAWLAARLEAGRAWWRHPWDSGRIAEEAGGAALLLGAAWWWRVGRLAWLRRRGGNPVRREAGRWLVRLGRQQGGPEGDQVREELRRLRYGAAPGWPDPAKIFRSAGRIWRAGKPKRQTQ